MIKKYFSTFKNPISLEEYRQEMILTTIIPLGYIIMGVFGLYNAFILKNMYVTIISATSAGMLLVVHIYFKKSQDIITPVTIGLVAYAVFLLAFNYINQNHGFGLVWTIIFPIVAIISRGRLWGTFLSLLFFIIVFAELYLGLSNWLNNQWNITGLLRFSFAYFAILYIIFMIDFTYENVYLKNKSRDKNSDKETQTFPTTKDPLTHLYNRQYLPLVSPLLSVQIQQQQPSVIFGLIKLDDFRAYNEQYGHQQGDAAIQKVAEALQQLVGSLEGILFRTGGNEFALTILIKQPKAVIQKLKNIHQLIADLNIENESSEYQKLTISAGLLKTENSQYFDFDDYFKQANQALQQAIKQGKNQTIITN